MRLSVIYFLGAVAMVGLGLFLSDASMEANLAVLLTTACLLSLSVFYFVSERKPAQSVLPRSYPTGHATGHDKLKSERIAELSRQMRNEPDPARYAQMRNRRDALWAGDDAGMYVREDGRGIN